MIYFFICHIGPLSRNNMVDTIMIPDSRSPLLLRSALLISHIINGKRTQKIISYFIGVFVCLFLASIIQHNSIYMHVFFIDFFQSDFYNKLVKILSLYGK